MEESAFPDVNQALDCGWFDEMTSGSLDIQWNALGHNIMSRVALYRLQHGQTAEAEAILLRGMAAGGIPTNRLSVAFCCFKWWFTPLFGGLYCKNWVHPGSLHSCLMTSSNHF